MSYISPIKLNTIPDMEEGWTDKIAKYIAGETDKLVLESCVKVACDVDEEELLKALQYDRGQYEKGYADGKRDAAPRWVRCEDELPDEVGSYLVYAPTYIGGSSSAKECKAGVMFARWLKGGHWSIEVGYYKRPGCVTHWMPLPEPPKEDA